MRTHLLPLALLALVSAANCRADFAAQRDVWIYASKLDLTCPDAADCFKKEGKDINWYRASTIGNSTSAHSLAENAANDDREKVPIDFRWLGVYQVKAARNDRALIGKATRLGIGYVYPLQADGKCGPASVTFSYEEKERPTALMAGLRRVAAAFPELKLASSGMPQAFSKPKAVACMIFQYKVLKEDRAAVKMTYTPTGAKETEASSHTLISGGSEHMFFTGDVITRKVSEVKFDNDTRTLSKKEKPERVYLGFNYQWGDVYSTSPTWSTDRLIAKVMVSASKKPLDSVGAGVGYQLKDFLYPTGGTDGGAIHVYAGHYWTKGEEGPRGKEWRIGLSFNIDTLIGWVKPASGK